MYWLWYRNPENRSLATWHLDSKYHSFYAAKIAYLSKRRIAPPSAEFMIQEVNSMRTWTNEDLLKHTS